MDISFILPSIRNHIDFSLPTITSIINSNNYNMTYEILVMSPIEIKADKTTWIEEKELLGPIKAVNILAKLSTGDNIIGLSDSIDLVDVFNIINEINRIQYDIKVIGLREGGVPKTPHQTGISTDIIRWPCMTRKTYLEYLDGYFFHPGFRYHCADNYLGAWTFLMQQPAKESEAHIVKPRQGHIPDCSNDGYDFDYLVKLCHNFHNNQKYTQEI